MDVVMYGRICSRHKNIAACKEDFAAYTRICRRNVTIGGIICGGHKNLPA